MTKLFTTDSKTEVAIALKPILAETFQLYLLTQNIHWNIVGPLFQSVHTLTEEQYIELAAAVDEIAERIRILGEKAPGGLKVYQELGSIKDGNENATAEEMIKTLSAAHKLIANNIRPLIGKAAEAGDEVTVGLLADRLTVHEKTQWMLNAILA